jgi:hypothetical protein
LSNSRLFLATQFVKTPHQLFGGKQKQSIRRMDGFIRLPEAKFASNVFSLSYLVDRLTEFNFPTVE